jgi:CHAD domain-containing protein
MSYQLRHSQTLGDNLRRICRKQIEGAIAVAKGEKESRDTPVHETRKHLKKTRAALRLVRKEIGRGLFREQDHCLRDVARLISDVRDAEVRLQTVQQFDRISRRRRQEGYGNLEQMLQSELENFTAASAEWKTQAVVMLQYARANIDHWALGHFNSTPLCRAVQARYRRARKALGRTTANPTAENFHVFRTEAKTLWYQVRILRPINPVVLKNLSEDLGSLGNLLGRAHDLNFLGERLRMEDGESVWLREAQKLLTVIETSQSNLQRDAAELGQHFFAERPRDFGARLASWLNAWEGRASPSIAVTVVS